MYTFTKKVIDEKVEIVALFGENKGDCTNQGVCSDKLNGYCPF